MRAGHAGHGEQRAQRGCPNGFRKSVEIDTTAADRAFFRLVRP